MDPPTATEKQPTILTDREAGSLTQTTLTAPSQKPFQVHMGLPFDKQGHWVFKL